MVLSGDSLRLTACNHVTYNVQDLERATKFWVEVLGIQQIPRMVNGTHLNWLQLPDGTMVHLIQNAAGISEPSHHGAFEVADIDAAFQALKDKGVTMASEEIQTRNDGQRAFYILDTEGNRVDHLVRVLESDGYASDTIAANAPYDLITANILAGPLIAMAAGLAGCLAPGGVAVLAGLLSRQADDVITAHVAGGLVFDHHLALGDWRTLILRRPT